MDGGGGGVELVCPWCERRLTAEPAGRGAGVVRVACPGCRAAFAAERVADRAAGTRAGDGARRGHGTRSRGTGGGPRRATEPPDGRPGGVRRVGRRPP
jgi:hypothetical protein